LKYLRYHLFDPPLVQNLQNAKTSILNLQREVKKEAGGLQYKIINLLTSPDFLPKIKVWDPSQCPPTDKKWKKVSGTASDPFGVFNLSLSIIYFLIQHNI
jgi:hypothetical protein